MGFFDFFKKKSKPQPVGRTPGKPYTKDEAGDLILIALNQLCDGKSTLEDAKNLVMSKGCTKREALIIAEKANELYLKHFANKINQ